MNNPIEKSTEQKSKPVQESLTIDGVTMIKQKLQENGEFYGMRYIFPIPFNYDKLLNWKKNNEIQILNFRKERI